MLRVVWQIFAVSTDLQSGPGSPGTAAAGMHSARHSRDDLDEERVKATKEPKDSKFTQQELRAWRPVLTPCWVTFFFFLLGVFMIPIGVACLIASKKVVELSSRYDHIPECSGYKDNNRDREQAVIQGGGLTCTVNFTVERDLRPPVFLYYELENYYQNHRRYVKSRSQAQLVGGKPTASDLKDCEPKLKINNSAIINPCGLTAWSFFNDSYTVAVQHQTAAVQTLHVRADEIAWKSDIQHKFGDYHPDNLNTVEHLRGGGQINGTVREDQHFIVWMRTAAMPHFRKLWGIVDERIPAGSTLQVMVSNRYNTYRFGGKKSVVFSTTSWLGGRNDFLGIAYITSGTISVLCGVMFFLLHLQFPRKQGDERFLSWNKGTH